MSLKKYISCHSDHSHDFQYVCLKEKKVFCVKCWIKSQHCRFCQSTRCGQYTKIAHTALNRALQYKNSKLLETFSASKESYEQLRVRFLQLNYHVSQIVKQFVQQKMPLLFWSMSNELIRSLGAEEIVNYNKFDSICTQLIRIIKSNDNSQKTEFLESAIGAYFDINHQIQGDMYVIKNSDFVNRSHKEDSVNKVLESMKNNLRDVLGNIKKGIRTTIDSELQRATSAIDQGVKYKGVAFHKMADNDCFRKREEYPYIDILSQEFGKITNEQTDLYNGFNLHLPELEANPEELLRLSKCLLKEKLFTIYDQINTVKSPFPYKYAYPISTTLSNDQPYESLILDAQKLMMEQYSESKSGAFAFSSLNLLIMGKELIIIRFYNLPKFCYSRKIYNYRPERTQYYEQLMDVFGLKHVQNRININPDLIEFTQQLTDTELVYSHFQTAYETLFLCNNEELVFEGQRVMANKGAQLLADTIERWKVSAQIDLKFNHPMKEVVGYFV